MSKHDGPFSFDDEFLDREVAKMKELPNDGKDFLTQAMECAQVLKQAIEGVGGTFEIKTATSSADKPWSDTSDIEIERDQLKAEVARLREALESVAMNYTQAHINITSIDKCGDKVYMALKGDGES